MPTSPAPIQVQTISKRLSLMLPEPLCELRHHDAWSLLAATILSAQSTDKRVNRITPALFEEWPTVSAMAQAAPEDVEPVVRSSGTYRQKAKRLVEAARAIVEEFGGEVPRSVEELTSLPGVARKTANLVLGIAYQIPTGVVVDTHVRRVAERLGLSAAKTVNAIEKDLMAAFPEAHWIAISHQLVLLGRYTCKARKPHCDTCPLNELCEVSEAPPRGDWEHRAEVARGRIDVGLSESLGSP